MHQISKVQHCSNYIWVINNFIANSGALILEVLWYSLSPGSARSQGISSHAIGLVCLDYCSLSTSTIINGQMNGWDWVCISHFSYVWKKMQTYQPFHYFIINFDCHLQLDDEHRTSSFQTDLHAVVCNMISFIWSQTWYRCAFLYSLVCGNDTSRHTSIWTEFWILIQNKWLTFYRQQFQIHSSCNMIFYDFIVVCSCRWNQH